MTNNQVKTQFLPLGIFLCAFGVLYWKAIYGMVLDWSIDENYSHGFLIPFISGYVAWLKRKEIAEAAITKDPLNWAIVILLVGLGIYLMGDIAGEAFTMRISMLFVLGGALLFCYGKTFFKSVSFPFFYLAFMIPLPFFIYDSFAFPLKMFVTKYSVGVLKLIGIPVVREGNVIILVNTTLEVADACSGMRSIMSLLALATALAYFSLKGWTRRGALIFLAIPIAMAANGIRVIGTGILATRFGSKAAEGFFHEFAGLVIFGVAMVMLVLSTYLLGKIGRKANE